MTGRGWKGLIWALALAPVAALAALYGALPEQVPMSWGLDGVARYGGKGELVLLCLLSPALAALFLILPRIDPRRKNYERFQGRYNSLCAAVLLFLCGADALVLVEALRPGTLSVWRVVVVGVGLLLAFCGNLLPKIKSNFFLGVRNPWTLSHPDVWNRANRLGGILLFALGLALAAAGLALTERGALAVLCVGILASAGIPNVLSYFWYRQKVDRDEPG